jgi:sugar/nucleoside kinase (ribokinase family)
VLINSKGERSFIYNIGANIALSPSHFKWDLISKSQILHIAGVGLYSQLSGEQLKEVLKKSKRLGTSTSIDTALSPKGNNWNSISQALPFIDYFLPSLTEASALARIDNPTDIADIFLKEGVKVLLLKMGESGSYFATNEGHWHIFPYKVDVLDTCGAGDSSAAGFLTGILIGWEPLKAAQFANAVGATCVKAIGATTGILSFDETVNFIIDNYLNYQKPIRIK